MHGIGFPPLPCELLTTVHDSIASPLSRGVHLFAGLERAEGSHPDRDCARRGCESDQHPRGPVVLLLRARARPRVPARVPRPRRGRRRDRHGRHRGLEVVARQRRPRDRGGDLGRHRRRDRRGGQRRRAPARGRGHVALCRRDRRRVRRHDLEVARDRRGRQTPPLPQPQRQQARPRHDHGGGHAVLPSDGLTERQGGEDIGRNQRAAAGVVHGVLNRGLHGGLLVVRHRVGQVHGQSDLRRVPRDLLVVVVVTGVVVMVGCPARGSRRSGRRRRGRRRSRRWRRSGCGRRGGRSRCWRRGRRGRHRGPVSRVRALRQLAQAHGPGDALHLAHVVLR
mmetsp:Transcript_20836/g.52554  ORF Transcript_20836/g.52554 Transcript_20836/m.52554 type:complete len:337 (+) Transcript_20836:557-1567(+)